MKSYGVSRTTAASPERVWSIWRDPNNWSQWNSGIKSASIGKPIGNGVHGVMTTNRNSTHDVVFSDVVEDRGFSMSMAGPGCAITFTCQITPDGSGSTIAQSVAFAGPMGWLMGAMMGNSMAQHFVPVLDDLAKAAEG